MAGFSGVPKATAILFCLALVALAACQTPYQPEGLGGGYEDVRLSDDTFEIRARGNGYSTEGHTRDIILLRAAQLARQNGFTHFQILDGSMRQSQRTYTTPGYSNTTANVYGNSTATLSGNTVYGNYSGFGAANTVYTPPQTHVITNQHGAALVKMFREPVPGAFDAQLIYDQLYPKLKG
jgi:hypothetical protein